MSGIIHVAPKSRPGRTALITLCIAAPVAALFWWLSSEGEPLPARPESFSQASLPSREYAPEPPDSPDEEPAPAVARNSNPAPVVDMGAEAAEMAARNAGIDIRLLTVSRPEAARAFLNEVHLKPSPQGGYVVAEVLPDSRYERLGLRPGDMIYSLDTPRMSAIDETSMVALIQQTELELDVYRNGSLTRLRYDYAANDEGARHDGPR
ncbi:MAG TPA: hypothetical protein VFL64_09300 [Rhizobacter sp.]|nr:hypothetical protein [Rhizobacter sp.]